MLPMLTRRPRRAAFFASLAALAALGACDIPTEAPILQQTWIVPSDSVTVDAAEIVPDGVTVTTGATPTFLLQSPGATFSTTLGALCGQPACQSGVTATVPTPAFSSPAGLLNATADLPDGVTAVTVIDGLIHLSITNNLGFDPLRPNGTGNAPFGTMTVTMTSGAVTSSYVINGATMAMPNGAATPFIFVLPAGNYTGAIDLDVALNVPAGNAATINGNNGLGIAASIEGLEVSAATVALNDEAVDTDPSEFDLEDIDFGDQVESGALLLTTVNPFTASADLDAVIHAPALLDGTPAVTITKPVTIPAQLTSTATVNLTKAEITSLLGRPGVTMQVSGTVSGTGVGNTVVLTPASRIIVRTQLQLILNIGA
jgi:hypothetical protein